MIFDHMQFLQQVPVLDNTILGKILEIEDEVIFVDFYQTLDHQIDTMLRDLKVASSERNLVEMREISHKVKSSCGLVGAMRLSKALEQQEVFSREGDQQRATEWVNIVAQIALFTKHALAKEIVRLTQIT
jgi:hypothetical protein